MQLTHTHTHTGTHTPTHTQSDRQRQVSGLGSVLDSFPIVNSHFRAAARGQACGRNEAVGMGECGMWHVASGKAASVANNLNAVARYIASHLINYAKNDVDSERCIRKMFATATVSGTTLQSHPPPPFHSPLSPAQLATSRTVLLCLSACVCV